MKIIQPLIILLYAIMLGACNKSATDAAFPSGTYNGQFVLSNDDPSANSVPVSGSVTVKFQGDHYESTANSNYIPAGGKGTFKILDKQLIFSDSTMHTANFDWNLILSGTYEYQLHNDSLVMSKTVGYNHYTYHLRKL